jgi:hexosaminidase
MEPRFSGFTYGIGLHFPSAARRSISVVDRSSNSTIFKRIVRTIAEFKMNQLNVYMEDSFPLEGQPLVGALDDQLSRTEFKELVAYAGNYHVEIIPATEGCGHLHKVLRFEQYNGMAERPRGHDLAPDDASAASYLGDFYAQLNSVFTSPLYHIGCDETHELGTGRSAARVQQEGYGRVYLDSLRHAYEIARRYRKQVIFWGDMAVAHPDLIAGLPKDIVVATWEYFRRSSYNKWITPFADAGIKIIICPWVGNANLIVPNYDVAAYNIANFIDEGKQAGLSESTSPYGMTMENRFSLRTGGPLFMAPQTHGSRRKPM